MFATFVLASVMLAGDGKGLPIVHGDGVRDVRAAKYLQSCVRDMTGITLRLVRAGSAAEPKAAVFVVSDNAPTDESFRVKVADGAIRFSGAAFHAAYDFCERVLGVRQYWPTEKDGRSVQTCERIVVEDREYGDVPTFLKRENWPYDGTEWGAAWRPGDSNRKPHNVHAPHHWWDDTNYNYRVTRPEIFQRTPDGQRAASPMLCYGNPLTLETYKERIVAEIERGVSAGGIVTPATKCVTVSQWDADVACTCEHCAKLRDPSLGNSGNASPIVWSYFTKELAEWLHAKYPEWTIVILPYKNTCDVPEGLVFPHRNVEALLCTMPGLAMLKQPEVKRHEELLIRAWAKATGRKVQNWHYTCWPAEFTKAPYVYGETVAAHYRDCRDVEVGTFLNGPFPVERHALSIYVWMKALWNPNVDVQALYDEFAMRMFGKAEKPMRELVRMQEEGWNRRWTLPKVSNKNIYEVSYSRADVLRMQALFAEARKLAADDATALRRIAYYESGFTDFFRESEEYASGSSFATTMMMKAGSMPVIDGVLAEDDWAKAEAYPFVPAVDPSCKAVRQPTELRVLWVPGQGVVYGVTCFDSDMAHARKTCPPCTVNETIEIFFDPTGNGEGAFGQIILDINNSVACFNENGPWKPEGIRTAVKCHADRWEAEVFVPFALTRTFAGAQAPAGTAGDGKWWNGNLVRMRYTTLKAKDAYEITRLYTRFSKWNKDTAAFGKFQFVE